MPNQTIMDEMKDRIRQIMEAQHMTQQTFANFIGMSPASLSSIFNNRTKPTLNTVEAIKGKLPRLNIEWLMFGHGSMFSEENPDTDKKPANVSDGNTEASLNFGEDTRDLFSEPVVHQQRTEHIRQVASPQRTEIRTIERPQRKITEIRVYFDDLTYETFVPKK